MSSIRFAIGLAAIVLLASVQAGPCQNSTNAPPPSAEKEGGIQGDPTGAIRALGGTDATDFKPKGTVTVPKMGGQGDEPPRHAPAGTAR